MSTAPITAPAPIATIAPAERAGARTGPELGASFGHALADARAAEHTATTSAEAFAAGDAGVGIHEVVIAAEKANLAIRFATTLKNKALEAYRELMNTQV
jgi:flagellar hook-basal body complex protein FliE